MRRCLRAAPLAAAIVLLSGCAAPSQPSGPAPSSRLTGPQGTPGQLTPILPATDLAVGPDQRFLLALLGPDNRAISDAAVDLAFFKVTGPGSAQLRSRADAEFRESLLGKGAYVARTDFDDPGEWGVTALVSRPGDQPKEVRVSFQVKEKSSTPTVGHPVPPSRTLTATVPQEIEKFSSARPANPAFYRLSIADAITQRKPVVILFATPGFCTSRLCGPSMEVLETLHAQHGDQVNLIHVEIYKDGRPNERQEMVPAVSEWGLTSEPWLFVVGTDGRLVDKLEGIITSDEVGPAVARLLGQ